MRVNENEHNKIAIRFVVTYPCTSKQIFLISLKQGQPFFAGRLFNSLIFNVFLRGQHPMRWKLDPLAQVPASLPRVQELISCVVPRALPGVPSQHHRDPVIQAPDGVLQVRERLHLVPFLLDHLFLFLFWVMKKDQTAKGCYTGRTWRAFEFEGAAGNSLGE